MKYKKVLVEPGKYYDAKIYRYPQDKDIFDLPLRWHFSYEYIFIKKGCIKLNKLDTSVILKENDIYFLNSQEVHSYAEISPDAEFIVVNAFTKSILPYLDDPHKTPTFKNPEGNTKNIITKSLSAIYDYKDLDDKLTCLRINAILLNVNYYILRDCMDSSITYIKGSESDDFDCAKSAIIYIRNNFQKDITLNEIASYVGMTPAHFSKYFKDKTSETFSKYLRRVRLEHAIDDIKNKGYTVKSAAMKNGFPNVNSLIGTCKAEYGHTPIEIKNFRVSFKCDN